MRLFTGSVTLRDLSQCADHFARWFLANGLLLNPDKTEAIVFGTASSYWQLIAKLQRIQSNLTRLLPRFTLVSSSIKELHWLMVPERVHYKVATLRPTYNILHTGMPVYLFYLLFVYTPVRCLCSSSQNVLSKPLYKVS